ncbi:hypothetical protein AB0M20_00540 [Actinoplanes sp. NPDC051633]|uniref:hypothetical protein n=1 Tax=Actinoplanes sp. NPDC051633 TaxID=3155670 RepID=UPI0034151C1B
MRASKVRGRILRKASATVSEVSFRGRPEWISWTHKYVKAVDGLSTSADQVVAIFGHRSQSGEGFVDHGHVQPGGDQDGDADGQRVGPIGLRP